MFALLCTYIQSHDIHCIVCMYVLCTLYACTWVCLCACLRACVRACVRASMRCACVTMTHTSWYSSSSKLDSVLLLDLTSSKRNMHSRYSLYLLYWYKSANSDAAAAAAAACASEGSLPRLPPHPAACRAWLHQVVLRVLEYWLAPCVVALPAIAVGLCVCVVCVCVCVCVCVFVCVNCTLV
jgi:hypothetical protein